MLICFTELDHLASEKESIGSGTGSSVADDILLVWWENKEVGCYTETGYKFGRDVRRESDECKEQITRRRHAV